MPPVDRNYANQFGDFVLDVEIPPTWEDDSWGNDACPSWRVSTPAGDLKVWVDYADPQLREMGPETPRFGVDRFVDGETDDLAELLVTDDWNDVLEHVLATYFARVLRSWLTPHDMDLIRQRNEDYTRRDDANSCATHEFCDANEAMEQACDAVLGHRLLDRDVLWDRAWTLAKNAGFKL